MSTSTLFLLLALGWVIINAFVLTAACISAARANRSSVLEEVPLQTAQEPTGEHAAGNRTSIRGQVMGSSSIK